MDTTKAPRTARMTLCMALAELISGITTAWVVLERLMEAGAA